MPPLVLRSAEGDRVAAVVCNTPETIVTMLAVTGLGGESHAWTSTALVRRGVNGVPSS